MSQLQQQNDPDALVDFRTPRFDLDSVYGSGPADQPYLYESNSPANRGVKLLVGHKDENGEFERDDLPRNQQGRALIGDPRNDENIIVSQLQLLFIRFHNKVVDHVRAKQPPRGLASCSTRRSGSCAGTTSGSSSTTSCARVVGNDDGASPCSRPAPRRRDRPPQRSSPGRTSRSCRSSSPSRPTASATAWSGPTTTSTRSSARCRSSSPPASPDPLEHLGGFRRLPSVLDDRLDVLLQDRQPARRSSAARSTQALRRRCSICRKGSTSSATRWRSSTCAAGARSACRRARPSRRAMGVTPLTAAELGLDAISLPAAARRALQAATPLWYYILREAQVKAQRRAPRAGRRADRRRGPGRAAGGRPAVLPEPEADLEAALPAGEDRRRLHDGRPGEVRAELVEQGVG